MSHKPDKKPRRLWVNAAFAAVLLLAAGALWLALRGGTARTATVDFGMGVTETLPLDTDYDYYYEVGGYVVHLQVKDGAVAFRDSQCPDHVCESFGWLREPGAWACCVPAGAYLSVDGAE